MMLQGDAGNSTVGLRFFLGDQKLEKLETVLKFLTDGVSDTGAATWR